MKVDVVFNHNGYSIYPVGTFVKYKKQLRKITAIFITQLPSEQEIYYVIEGVDILFTSVKIEKMVLNQLL